MNNNEPRTVSGPRRFFLKGCLAAAASAAIPAKSFSSVFLKNRDLEEPDLFNENNGSCVLKFAHLTDTHIGDIKNPIRSDLLGGTIAFFYERPQDPMCAKLLDSAIQSINSYAETNTMDFCIATGDLTDMSMKREAQWLTDIADGRFPRNFRENDMVEVNPAGMNIPWYACLGNHDLLLFGALPSKLVEYIVLKINESPDFDIIFQDEWINIVSSSTSQVPGHGFFNQSEKKDGYYSFTPNQNIHCIVLNTAADNHMEGLADRFLNDNQDKITDIISKKQNLNYLFQEIAKEFASWINRENLYNILNSGKESKFNFKEKNLNAVFAMGSDGTLDRDQYNWMVNEIENNQDKICIIFSHHGSCDFMEIPGNINQAQFDTTLCRYDNVIAHICGHSHENKIDNISDSGKNYYRIRTSSLIEYPQEWRAVEILKKADGKGVIKCKMIRHNYSKGFLTAAFHWRIFFSKNKMYGQPQDRNTELEFEIPSGLREKNSFLSL